MRHLAWCAWTALSGGSTDFVESHVDLRTEDFGVHAVDLNGDGRRDLLLSLLEDDQRQLQVHWQAASGTFPAAPDWQMSLPPDAVCFALADVRDEPGLEVLLLARSGIFSVSTANASLRGNLRRERTMTLFPDLSEDGPLPRWDLTSDLDGDGTDELLLISDDHLVALARRSGASPQEALTELLRIPCRAPLEQRASGGSRFGPGGFEAMQGQAVALPYFPGAFSSRTAMPSESWLLHSTSWRLPALVDWSGDGRKDALYQERRGFELLVREPDGSFTASPSQEVPLPDVLDEEDDWEARLIDLDGDGQVEVAVTRQEEEDHLYLVFGRSIHGGIDDQPRARVKLSALGVEYEEVDVDQDGRQDLIATMVDIPSGVSQASRIRLDVTLLVYQGQEGARLARRPALRYERTFRPEQMTGNAEASTFELGGDFNGDGCNDLLLLQPDGLVEIRLLSAGSRDWTLSEEPMARFRPASKVRSAQAMELSGDPVTDLILRHDSAITIYVSRAGE